MSDRRDRARAAALAKFLSIAHERLARLNNGVVHLEAHPHDRARAEEVAREIHTLKGESKLMRFEAMNVLAHRTEELLLAALSRGFGALAESVSTDLLAAFDVLSALVLHAEAEREGRVTQPVDSAPVLARIDAALSLLRSAAPAVAIPSPGDQGVASGAPVDSSAQSAAGPVEAPPVRRAAGDRYRRVEQERVRGLSELSAEILLGQHHVRELAAALDRALVHVGEPLVQLELLVSGLGEPASVPTRELVRFAEEVRRLSVAARGSRRRALAGRDALHESLFDQRTRVEQLDDRIRGLLLAPLSVLFERLPRAVRDLAHELQKSVELHISGDDVELDLQVLEALFEPLLHLIRNALDHGLELPAQRRAAGKPETGRLSVAASRLGTTVAIELSDDGPGIDAEAVRASAVALGVISAPAAATLDLQGSLDLVFAPGLSTRKRVTDLSGRGVGLDIVKRRIEDFGGSVTVHSEPGAGTRFCLRVPTTLLLTQALIVDVAGASYALSAESVECVLRVAVQELEATATGPALRLEGDPIALLPLSTLLGLPASTRAAALRHVVVVRHGKRRLALSVDALVGQRQVVQRPAGRFLEGEPVIDGVAVLESGTVAVLLDTRILLDLATRVSARELSTRGAEERRKYTLLVVDDSDVTRDLVAAILRAHGYGVREAVNGQLALELLSDFAPDLIVTDLEMPVLDGLGLLRAVRSHAQLREVPVVVFSTRGSDADKRRAAELGSDAYLVKGDFRDEDLIETVRRFLPEEEAA